MSIKRLIHPSLREKQTVKYVYTSELVKNISIADYQREVHQDHVEKIYNFLKETVNENEIPTIPTAMVIGVCRGEGGDKHVLLDGQHRFFALKRILEEDKVDVPVLVIFELLKDGEEMKKMFLLVNKSKPIGNLPDSVGHLNDYMKARNFFWNRYKNAFSGDNSKKAYKPNILRNEFFDFLKESIEGGTFASGQELINAILDIDKKLSVKNENYFRERCASIQKNPQRFKGYIAKIYNEDGVQEKFFFGIFDDFRQAFPWLKKKEDEE